MLVHLNSEPQVIQLDCRAMIRAAFDGGTRALGLECIISTKVALSRDTLRRDENPAGNRDGPQAIDSCGKLRLRF